MNIEQIVKESFSIREVAIKLGNTAGGWGFRKTKKQISHIDKSHFSRTANLIKYPYIVKKCIVCSKNFETQLKHPKEKVTCSHSCANTHFRTGKNHGNYRGGKSSYDVICFRYHKKKCVVCPEENIVAVHHFDGNHDNNEPTNLTPMCPTHHCYLHSKFKDLIFDKVKEYHDNFLNSFDKL